MTKRLERIGYHLEFVQTPYHEFDFAIHQLAENLTDGIRLCRLVELLIPGERDLYKVLLSMSVWA